MVNRVGFRDFLFETPFFYSSTASFSSHRAVRVATRAGEIGDLHQVIISSRDPALPLHSYLESAGGLLRDMTIHNFDLARFMLDDDPVEVFAVAQALIDPELGAELNEVDTAMTIMRATAGIACCTTMIASLMADYPQNASRRKFIGTNGVCPAIGIIVVDSG